MLRLPIIGFRRREDRWAVTTAILIILVGLSAILGAAYMKLQTEWNVKVAIETREFGWKVAAAFADDQTCSGSVNKMLPIDISKASSADGASMTLTIDGGLVLGDDLKPHLAAYIEVINVKFANAVLQGQTIQGPDAYIADLVIDVRRRYTSDEVESHTLGRVLFLSEKNIFNTYTIKGCSAHETVRHQAQLCTNLGGTFDSKDKKCLASCPAQQVTLNSGLKYQIPSSPSGSVKHLVNAGEIQLTASCSNGAWMMFDEKFRDPTGPIKPGDIMISRLTAASE